MDKETIFDKLRMMAWFVLAVLFYAIAWRLGQDPIYHAASTVFFKLGNVTAGAYVGYWVDRTVLGRVCGEERHGLRGLSRAILIAVFAHGISSGL